VGAAHERVPADLRVKDDHRYANHPDDCNADQKTSAAFSPCLEAKHLEAAARH
jgi:hypothetical protein